MHQKGNSGFPRCKKPCTQYTGAGRLGLETHSQRGGYGVGEDDTGASEYII